MRESVPMVLRGSSLTVTGEVESDADLMIEGRVEGSVWCEDSAVTVAAGADVSGQIFARDVTVFGRASGEIVGTEVVDLRPESSVDARIITPRLILNDGALFHGRVEPQHLEAAVRVARYQRQQRHGGPPAAPAPSPKPPRQLPVISRRESHRR